MKPIILSIAILAAAGSAYWGYSVGADLKAAGEENIATKDNKDRNERELRDASDKLLQEKDALSAETTKQALVANELAQVKEQNAELTEKLETVKAEYDKIKQEMEALTSAEDPRDPEQMAAELDRLAAAMKEKEDRLAEIATLTETTMAKLTPLETDYKKLQDRLVKYDSSVANNSREYAITAVDPKWGFVIIDAGQAAGLDPAVPLLVLRNGQRQAVLQISQVEKNQTVADIVPSSVKPGNTLQVGDRVIPRRPQGQ